MIEITSIILITLPFLGWCLIVSSKSLRKRWIYVLITSIIYWGVVALINYLNPTPPHYE